MGFRHILGGLDHLLFVLCLVLPVRRWQSLVTIVTAFTVAHSLTLAAAALGSRRRRSGFRRWSSRSLRRRSSGWPSRTSCCRASACRTRWPVAFGFGLVHGFGFSFALRETLQFAGGNLVSALAAFNIGVELGQLAALAVAVPLLWLLQRYAGADARADR